LRFLSLSTSTAAKGFRLTTAAFIWIIFICPSATEFKFINLQLFTSYNLFISGELQFLFAQQERCLMEFISGQIIFSLIFKLTKLFNLLIILRQRQ